MGLVSRLMRPRYARWLESRIAWRAKRYPVPAAPPTFALLTVLYEKSDAALFEETARSVAEQSLPCTEWVILAQGAISPALRDALQILGQKEQVRLLEQPRNLGIVGGLRLCLEAARARYVVPLDGDDLLTPDALQVLASALARDPATAFAYSDEDALVEGTPRQPYWRPDWDEVLNLETSYIWHLCAF